jgi:hypothetical protein
MIMNRWRIAILTVSLALAAAVGTAQTERRSAYSYVRETSGEVTVVSGLNGTVEARRNLPISPGDELRTDDPGRAEVALADGNVLHVGGGTSVQFVSLSSEQGSDDTVSAISLKEGSVILSVMGSDDKTVPRIDTEEVTVYGNAGSRVRVNADPRRGSAVIVRAGSVEVKTQSGSYTVRAGNYLLTQGQEEPEIARGSFSRDRFDSWAADRLSATYDTPQTASSQYVGEDYSGDVSSLEGNGDWDYNSTYGNYVWRPNVAVGWTPYSNGSWYYTPAGLTWWSYDPWGWYPFHYGNWFFDAGWNSWCWSPGWCYSPAWVYWSFTPGFVGWCPLGWYGFNSPWWNNRQWAFPRGSAFAIHGTFPTHRVDLRGWNFTGANGFGTTRGRVDVIPGTRVADRLGNQMSISSRPIVVPSRNGVGLRDSLQNYVREAPRAIDRTTDRATQQSLEPVVARDRELPRSSVETLRNSVAVVDRGRLSGPGASEIAPRGTAVVERGTNTPMEGANRVEADRSTGRTVIRNDGRTAAPTGPAGPSDTRSFNERGLNVRPDATQAWRSRPSGSTASSARPDSGFRSSGDTSSVGRDTHENWRTRYGSYAGSRPPSAAGSESGRGYARRPDDGMGWRSHDSNVPPARRVIEGSVPGRRTPAESGPPPRQRSPRDEGFSQYESARPSAPPSRSAPPSAPPSRSAPSHSAPSHSAPAPHSAPPSSSGGSRPHGHGH